MQLCIHMFTPLSVCLSINLSIYLSIYPSIYLSISLSLYLSLCERKIVMYQCFVPSTYPSSYAVDPRMVLYGLAMCFPSDQALKNSLPSKISTACYWWKCLFISEQSFWTFMIPLIRPTSLPHIICNPQNDGTSSEVNPKIAFTKICCAWFKEM